MIKYALLLLLATVLWATRQEPVYLPQISTGRAPAAVSQAIPHALPDGVRCFGHNVTSVVYHGVWYWADQCRDDRYMLVFRQDGSGPATLVFEPGYVGPGQLWIDAAGDLRLSARRNTIDRTVDAVLVPTDGQYHGPPGYDWREDQH